MPFTVEELRRSLSAAVSFYMARADLPDAFQREMIEAYQSESRPRFAVLRKLQRPEVK